jgi:hypothetical protein
MKSPTISQTAAPALPFRGAIFWFIELGDIWPLRNRSSFGWTAPGNVQETQGTAAPYSSSFNLSADGRAIAVTVSGHVSLMDLSRNIATQLTFGSDGPLEPDTPIALFRTRFHLASLEVTTGGQCGNKEIDPARCIS